VYGLRLELEEGRAVTGQLEAKLSQLAAAEQAAAADAAAVRSALQAISLNSMPPAVAGVAAGDATSLGKQVGTAISALVERVQSLEQQVAQQQAALEQAQQRPQVVASAVQCDSQPQSDAAMQAEPGSAVPASTQTEAAGPEAGYGQAHPEQQQVAELTQQLADARLAAVAAKADQAAAQSKLQAAERQVGGTLR